MSTLKTAGTCLVSAWMALGFAAASADDSIARLSSIEGVAMVDMGAGFEPAVEGMRVKAGDRVLTKETGMADVVFDTGCHHTVRENEVFPVRTNYCEMVYSKGAPPPEPAPIVAAPVAVEGTPWWIPAGVIGAVAILAAVIHNNDDDSSSSAFRRPPISP